MEHIHEGVRKYKEKAASDAQVKADINFLKQRTANTNLGNVNSPTKTIRNQLANTMITQQPVGKTTQGDPFSSVGGGGGNYSIPEAHVHQQQKRKRPFSRPASLYIQSNQTRRRATLRTVNSSEHGDESMETIQSRRLQASHSVQVELRQGLENAITVVEQVIAVSIAKQQATTRSHNSKQHSVPSVDPFSVNLHIVLLR